MANASVKAGETEPTLFFVDQSATGAGTGLSWEDAFTELQPALNTAVDGDEIWVACATYEPTQLLDEKDPRSLTFSITSGVSLFGGFAGTETSLDEREPNPFFNQCVLAAQSIAKGGDEGPYHVISISGVTEPILLDGFAVVGGRATGEVGELQQGGGMRISLSNVALRNMHFEDNRTVTNGPGFGGAVYSDRSTLTVADVSVRDCASGRGGGFAIQGGDFFAQRMTVTDSLGGFAGGPALFGRAGARMEVVDSHFENNVGNNQGGAILQDSNARLTVRRSVFLGNLIQNNRGGAIARTGADPLIIENSVFVGNAARVGVGGGAISIGSGDGAVITNSTIVQNESGDAGAAIFVNDAELLVQNSLIFGNAVRGAENVQIGGNLSNVTVEFSLIEGGFAGTGNIDLDPMLVEMPDPGDGSWLTSEDNDFGDVRLTIASPAIDAGNNLADIDGAGEGATTAGDVLLDVDQQARRVDIPGVLDTGQGDAPVIDIGAFELSDEIFGDGFERL